MGSAGLRTKAAATRTGSGTAAPLSRRRGLRVLTKARMAPRLNDVVTIHQLYSFSNKHM